MPLDPKAPTARPRATLAIVNARIIVSFPMTNSLFGNMQETSILSISAEHIEQTQLKAVPAPQAPHMSPSDAAFFIFTSVSTGLPSGVPIEHRDMVTAARAY